MENHTFHPYTGFLSQDLFDQGYLTARDLIDVLRNYGFEILEKEAIFMIRFKSKNKIYDNRFEPSLVRDDTLTYDEYLNLISPSNQTYLANKLSNLQDKYGGKEKQLAEYTYRNMMEVVCGEIEIYRDYEALKDLLIEKYGYCGTEAFNMFSGDRKTESLSYNEFKTTMNTVGIDFYEEEYEVINREIDFDNDGYIQKSEFQDLLTPFDQFVNLGASKKGIENLTKEELERYMENTYKYKKDPKGSGMRDNASFMRLTQKLDQIFPNLDNPNHPINKNLSLDENYRVNYDILSKKCEKRGVRNFEDYYDVFFKRLYFNDKQRQLGMISKDYKGDRNTQHTKQNLGKHFGSLAKAPVEDTKMIKRDVHVRGPPTMDIFKHQTQTDNRGYGLEPSPYGNAGVFGGGKFQNDNFMERGTMDQGKSNVSCLLGGHSMFAQQNQQGSLSNQFQNFKAFQPVTDKVLGDQLRQQNEEQEGLNLVNYDTNMYNDSNKKNTPQYTDEVGPGHLISTLKNNEPVNYSNDQNLNSARNNEPVNYSIDQSFNNNQTYYQTSKGFGPDKSAYQPNIVDANSNWKTGFLKQYDNYTHNSPNDKSLSGHPPPMKSFNPYQTAQSFGTTGLSHNKQQDFGATGLSYNRQQNLGNFFYIK